MQGWVEIGSTATATTSTGKQPARVYGTERGHRQTGAGGDEGTAQWEEGSGRYEGDARGFHHRLQHTDGHEPTARVDRWRGAYLASHLGQLHCALRQRTQGGRSDVDRAPVARWQGTPPRNPAPPKYAGMGKGSALGMSGRWRIEHRGRVWGRGKEGGRTCRTRKSGRVGLCLLCPSSYARKRPVRMLGTRLLLRMARAVATRSRQTNMKIYQDYGSIRGGAEEVDRKRRRGRGKARLDDEGGRCLSATGGRGCASEEQHNISVVSGRGRACIYAYLVTKTASSGGQHATSHHSLVRVHPTKLLKLGVDGNVTISGRRKQTDGMQRSERAKIRMAGAALEYTLTNRKKVKWGEVLSDGLDMDVVMARFRWGGLRSKQIFGANPGHTICLSSTNGIKTNYMYTSSAQNIPCTVLAYRGSATTALKRIVLKTDFTYGDMDHTGKQLKKSGFLAAISIGCSAPNQDLERSVIHKWLLGIMAEIAKIYLPNI
ncbi:hypothetical protein B0H14DRAFT_2614204 [Mycena olivaceomarginata]|nr:hypothetical protein B0H14DRAFT_2614204 [Mycena olivaceomarginata]